MIFSGQSIAQYRATGKASFYARKFEGRRTASGEIFSNELLTAAHRTLPFGTWVRVTNLNNGKQVVVRINDRGPYVPSRIIDLSQAAADSLDFREDGVVMVLVEEVHLTEDTPDIALHRRPEQWQAETWLGLWEGTLYVYDRSGSFQQLPMALEVAVTDQPGRYHWRLSYDREVRPYELIVFDDSVGQCAIDEQQGVLLLGRCWPRQLHFRFSVGDNLLDLTYDLLNDTTLLFSMKGGPAEPTWVTGLTTTEKDQQLHVQEIHYVHRAVLYRRVSH